LQQFDFQCVICDESHNLKEKKSQRCQLGLPLLQKAKRLVLLSGTPALARPVELWPQVYCIAPKLFGSYTAFTKKFCNAQRGRFGWDVSGISNANELFDNLRQIMVRRLKSDVLSELPPKQRSIIPIKMDSNRVKECRELMTELEATKLSVSELVGQDANDAHFEHRRLLMQAYQASGIGKANAVTEYLLDWLAGAGTQKILVFAHHQHVMDALEHSVAKKYKGVGHIRIDGTVPSSERAVRVRKFQTNSQVRVAILSMTAAGVGITLTAASSVLFAELHWTPGVLAQAEDRCHRIGQQNAVNVMYCVCKDESLSVDMRLWAMLGRKVGNLGRVIDGCKVRVLASLVLSSYVYHRVRNTDALGSRMFSFRRLQ
jgi:SWI/SNF-related matrix-associated actin-dependent regulator 1 of chromatin subfamily A